MSTVRFGSTGRLLLLLSLPLAMGGIAQSAQAQTYDTINISYSLPDDAAVDINYTGAGAPTGGLHEQTWAVPFTASLDNGTTDHPHGTSFNVYCIDLTHDQYQTSQAVKISTVGPGSTATTMNPPVSAAELQEASWLINNTSIPTPVGSLAFDTAQAGLQVALWAVVSGDTIGTNNAIGTAQNPFYISTAAGSNSNFNNFANIVTAADNDLNTLGAQLADGGGGGYGTLYELNPDDPGHAGQNVLGGNSAGGNYKPTVGITPEGSSLSLFAISASPLFGAFWLKRRRQLS